MTPRAGSLADFVGPGRFASPRWLDSAALVRFRRFLRSLRRVVSALDSEFVELEVAGEGVELPSGVCSASSAGSGVVIPTCLSLLQVITSLQPSTASMAS